MKFLTVLEAARLLGLSKGTICRHAEALGGVKIGRQWRFNPERLRQGTSANAYAEMAPTPAQAQIGNSRVNPGNERALGRDREANAEEQTPQPVPRKTKRHASVTAVYHLWFARRRTGPHKSDVFKRLNWRMTVANAHRWAKKNNADIEMVPDSAVIRRKTDAKSK
jgi:excisionase family DNA binding protein